MQSNSRNAASRAFGAGAWTVGSRLAAKAIDLVLLLCLARFLGPGEFGLVAMAMAAVFVVEALFELPIAAALIRVPSITEEMLHTAFTISLLRGLIIALLMMIVSVPLSAFNNEPRLFELLCVLSLAPALRGLVSPRLVEYTRVFNFRPDALMELSGKVIAFTVSISIAVLTRSYWAIAAATVCGPLVSTLLSYVIAPLRPRLTLSNWKDFSSLIGWNFVAQFSGAMNWQVDRLIMPRFTSTIAFGQYAMAKQVSEIPIQALITPLHRPAMTALALATESRGSRYLQLSRAVALLLLPVLGVPLLWPEVLVRLGLGAAWSPAAEWLRWVSGVTILGIPAMLLSPLAMTLDRAEWLAARSIIELLFRVPLVWIGIVYLGIPGAIAASAVATACGTCVAILVVHRLLGTTPISQIMTMWRPAIALLPSGAILLILKNTISETASVAELCVKAALFILLYLFAFGLCALLLWKLSGRPPGLEKQLIDKLSKRKFFTMVFRV